MKLYLTLATVVFLAMLLLPLTVIQNNSESKDSSKTSSAVSEEATSTSQKESTEKADGEAQVISVMLNKSGEVVDVDMFEYIVGVLAAEMPVFYHEEALKAQAVASYTYAMHIKSTSASKESDIVDDSCVHQGYLDIEAQKAKFGDNYETARAKLEKAVKSVYGKQLVFDDMPAKTVYHALNTGSTENCKNIWQSEISYLSGTSSDGDRLSPDFCTEVALTAQQFRETAEKLCKEEITSEESEWIGEIKATPAGTVTSIILCGKTFSGSDIRTAYELKSAAFTLKYKDGMFIFKVYGNGHMVGMSQYGADYMARQGSNYKEILMHYYHGTQLV